MKTANKEIASGRIASLLIYLGPIVTLAVNPWTNYDPISLPKMLVLSTFAFAIVFLIFSSRLFSIDRLPKSIFYLSMFLLTGLFSTLLFSGAPLTQQIWGSFGRNTGLLTYLSLMATFLAVSMLQKHEFYGKLVKTLVWTSFPMTLYCLLQYQGLDPVPWSEKNIFGTLGNINFLSAFLGMTSILVLIQALNPLNTILLRVFFFIKVSIDLYLIFTTGSIQGPMIFLAGVAIFGFVYIFNLKRLKMVSIFIYFGISVTATTLVIMGLRNVGPLAKSLFQPSVLFREDYWHAGLEMTIKRPLFGVGLDSYGDWYREARGEISTLRTGPGRVTNTAHNIFLDISSNGGIVLGLSYLLLVLAVLFFGIKTLSSTKELFTYQTAAFCVWIAYQVQSLVSINQIGVGIWGWIFSGVLVGMYQIRDLKVAPEKFYFKRAARKGRLPNQLSARDALALFAGASFGFILGITPLQADVAYRTASSRGLIGELRLDVMKLGSTQFHRELVLDFALKNNLVGETKTIAEELVRDYPRNYFGWRVLSVSTANPESDRLRALERARELDPFNPELR